MAQFPNMFPVDLQDGPKIVRLNEMYLADALANRIGVIVTDNKEAVTLSGTCAGKVLLANGGTVAVTGTISGNQAYIDLPSAAYVVEGPIEVFVCVTASGTTTTLLAAMGNVRRTQTGTVVDPGTIIPSVSALIESIEDAVDSIPADYSGLLATIAPTFSNTTAYSAGTYAWYSGTLYRFTADHAAGSWTGSDAVAVVIGTELTSLKSAFNNSTGNTIIDSWVMGKRLATNGDSVDFNSPSSSSTSAYQVVDCQEGDVFTLTGKGTHSTYRLWCWCETDGTIVSRPSSNLDYNCVEITCPENATKLVVNVNTLNPYQLLKGELLSRRIDAELSLLEKNTNVDLSTATEHSYIIDSGNEWASSSTAKCATVPIVAGTRKVDITAGSTNGVVAFLKNLTNMSTGNTPNFATGYSGRIKITEGKTYSFEVGADAAYLYYGKISTSGTDMSISSAVYSADVLRVSDENRIIGQIDNAITSIMPTLYEGWFDWTLEFSYTAQGGTNSSHGFATTKPIAVVPGNQIINLSSAENGDEVPIGFFVVEFNGNTFDRRVKVEAGERYIVPDDIDNIRIMFGFGSTSGITITKPMLSEYFAVKMLTMAEQNDFETPVYVAYGASTTIGAVHRFTGHGMYYSAYSFPDYIGRALNLKTYNHGHGTTGFLARADGTAPNFMDAIYADDDLLKTASLVTIIFGYGNDHGAGLPIGLYDDYYPYDEEGYHPSGSEGITTMLTNGATLMGCLNWCIKWISEHYPKVTLVVIFGSPSANEDRTITKIDNPDETSGRPPYKLTFVDPYPDPGTYDPYALPTSASGAAQIRNEYPKLKKALNMPFINLTEEGCPINYYNAMAKDADGKYAIFSTTGTESDQTTWTWNSHPNDAGYKMYAQFLAGKVISLFKH